MMHYIPSFVIKPHQWFVISEYPDRKVKVWLNILIPFSFIRELSGQFKVNSLVQKELELQLNSSSLISTPPIAT